jgi:hypothetical protein
VPATRFPAQLSKGKKNGDLLRAAEASGYEVLLTVDQGIPRQNNPAHRNHSIILVRSRTNQLEDLVPLAAVILKALDRIGPGETVVVPSPE